MKPIRAARRRAGAEPAMHVADRGQCVIGRCKGFRSPRRMYRAAEVTLPVSRDTILEKTRFSTFSLVPPSGVKMRMVGGESASAFRLPLLQTLILKKRGVRVLAAWIWTCLQITVTTRCLTPAPATEVEQANWLSIAHVCIRDSSYLLLATRHQSGASHDKMRHGLLSTIQIRSAPP
jgi:hypothetical protein